MTTARMPRLEQVLGARLDQLDWQAIDHLIAAGTPEGTDIEYKRDHYGSTDSDRRELAKDVAALANTAGGLLLIGVAEEQGRAAAVAPVSLADADTIRYRQIIANNVMPLPRVEILAIAQPDTTGQGVLALIVPRSPLAPHAVLHNDTLRYPRRHGTTTMYLSESEVASAYRDRFAQAADRQTLAIERESELIDTLDPAGPWLIATLVPDLPGHMSIDRATYQDFQARMVLERPGMPWYGASYHRFKTGYRRLRADGGTRRGENESGPTAWCATELHTDGSGAYAMQLADMNARQVPAEEPDHVVLVSDEAIAGGILAGLEQLAEHAWTTGSGGSANLRARVWPVRNDRRTALGHARQFGPDAYTYPVHASPPAVDAQPLDLLHPAGPGLVSAAALLLREIAQGFGVPEVGQLDPDGRIRARYWSQQSSGLAAWCEKRGIELTDEVLPRV